jgi:hypothetical protein
MEGVDLKETEVDYLAHWLSEFPNLIEKVQEKQRLCQYFRTHPVRKTYRLVPDEMWEKIVPQLME